MNFFKVKNMMVIFLSFLAIFLFTNTSHSAQTNPIFLKALTSNPGSYCKTYYKSGESLILWAWFLPTSQWGVPLDGRSMTINLSLVIDSVPVINYNRTLTMTSSYNYIGVSFNTQLPANLADGASGTLTVNITVPDYDVVIAGDGISAPPAMNQSRIDIVNGNYSDIVGNFMGDLSQTCAQWQGVLLGNCQDDTKMWNKGSATASKTFIFNSLARKYVYSPAGLNTVLMAKSGYTLGANGYYWCCPTNETVMINGVSKPMNLIGAPQSVHWDGCVVSNVQSYFSKIDQYISKGWPVMIETNKNGQQYFVIVGKRDSGEWDLYDPWDGQRYIMSKAGITKEMITKIYFYSTIKSLPYMLLLD